METEDEKMLRNRIQEILLGSDIIKDKSINQKKGIAELKKDCYVKLVDLKNEFESVKDNPDKEKIIKKIDDLVESLGDIKRVLNNTL